MCSGARSREFVHRRDALPAVATVQLSTQYTRHQTSSQSSSNPTMADAPSPAGATAPSTTSISQKRPLDNPEDSTIPRTKPAREKKDSWRKKEALQTGDYPAVTKSGKHTGTSTPKAGDIAKGTQLPALMSYRLPAPQALDYYGHRAPPTVLQEDLEVEGEYYAVNDQYVLRDGRWEDGGLMECGQSYKSERLSIHAL